MLAKATGVIMTTMKFQIQLPDVERALAGARILRGTISAGYSQVMPSQPMAKNVLKTKRNTVWAIPALVPFEVPEWVEEILSVMARITIESDMPMAPKIIRVRRPNLSTVNTATQEAMKYSVPLRAEIRRDIVALIPILFSSRVGM